jgi:hypothetical protein
MQKRTEDRKKRVASIEPKPQEKQTSLCREAEAERNNESLKTAEFWAAYFDVSC